MANILVVDDEKDLAGLLKSILMLKGYNVEIAQSGQEAIEKVEKTAFDLCLLDIRLPDMNGVELFLKIKNILPCAQVIMITGFAVEDLIEEALKEGAYACIHKPFDIEKFFLLIENILISKRKVILIADDIEKVRQEIKAILKDRNYVVCEAKTGKEVIDKIKERQYNLILLDYGLSDMNGLDIFHHVKAIDKDVVVILMLDKHLEELIKDVLKIGFYGWIEKPIDSEDFLKIVEESLKEKIA